MKTIRHTVTLYYYDGDQVFEARDSIGGHYIAVKEESLGDHERYLVAGVSPERMRQFRSGTIDLRSLLVDRDEAEWYFGSPDEDQLKPRLMIQLQESPIEQCGCLPEQGFYLHELPTANETMSAAHACNNLVIEIAVDPPEAAEGHRIHLGTLVGLLEHFQALVKHAYTFALRDVPSGLRRSLDLPESHLLDVVVPAKTGSFGVLLEASSMPDLLGMNELSRALHKIDELFEKVKDPDQTLAIVRAHRGHLAGAYLRMLQFLVESRTGLRYSWAEPSSSEPRFGYISLGEAGPLVDLLTGVSNLGAENVQMDGELSKADRDNGTWRISTQEGDFSGKVREGGPSLAGLKIGSEYRFDCLEEIEEIKGTGREQRTLYLVEYSLKKLPPGK